MRLLVTGGSSFVGAHFCQMAVASHEVFAAHHSTPLRLNGVTPVKVDLRRARDQRRLAAIEPDAVIHVACKIKARPTAHQSGSEAAAALNRQMMDAVLELGRPVIYASSTVVHWTGQTPYAAVRREDEQRLRESGLPYAILRPSAPYGPRLANHSPRHRESFHTLVELVRRSPIVPVIGDGQYRRQPIHVADLSRAILALLERPLPSQAWDAGGAEALRFDEIIDQLAAALHTKPHKLHLPASLFAQLARLSADFDPDLIAAAGEDEVADPTALAAVVGFTPRPFSKGLRDLL
jgi:nucleoside-diphosphate-sugar epimerase